MITWHNNAFWKLYEETLSSHVNVLEMSSFVRDLDTRSFDRSWRKTSKWSEECKEGELPDMNIRVNNSKTFFFLLMSSRSKKWKIKKDLMTLHIDEWIFVCLDVKSVNRMHANNVSKYCIEFRGMIEYLNFSILQKKRARLFFYPDTEIQIFKQTVCAFEAVSSQRSCQSSVTDMKIDRSSLKRDIDISSSVIRRRILIFVYGTPMIIHDKK